MVLPCGIVNGALLAGLPALGQRLGTAGVSTISGGLTIALGLLLGQAPVLGNSLLPEVGFPSPEPVASSGGTDFSPPLGTADDYLPEASSPEASYLLLKLSERTLYLYHQQTLLSTYPVAVGREGWETPTGQFTIFQMQQNPTWEHPFTGELVPPGDDNPLGHRWLGFWNDGTNSIGFHGTPDESSIGRAVSHGCVRLRNQDVIALYEQVALGTPVYVVP